MKIHILFPIREQPTGGGNQFLKALRQSFRNQEHYAEEPADAGAFIYNSYQYIPEVWSTRRNRRRALFIHRVDGPMRLYNKPNDYRDTVVYRANSRLADGTVFQSEWSRKENLRLGMKLTRYNVVIPNAPEPAVFHPAAEKPFDSTRKVRLMALSWSSNWKKGFAILKWLDEHLDFARFDVTFMGNSPIVFNRVRHLPPSPSTEVADELRRHDIFLAISSNESCSNTLMEALSCGLPVIALPDGCYPEMIGEAGEFFSRPEEIPALLDRVISRYDDYKSRIVVRPLAEIAKAYVAFAQMIEDARREGKYRVRSFTSQDLLWLQWTQWSWHMHERIQARMQRLSSGR